MITVQHLGTVPYEEAFARMQSFTEARQDNTSDELWTCEHPPVFTQGLAGLPSHLLNPGDIPVIQTNRGGQVTYHGPGQLVVYPLLNLQRRGYFVKEYVYRLEEAVIRTLRDVNITGHRVRSAPGIYVRLADPSAHQRWPDSSDGQPNLQGLGKVAALGIKVHRHCTYHGLSLNVRMNLEPFLRINPCGYAGLQTVDLHTIGVDTSTAHVQERLLAHLIPLLGT
ncbi:MAG: Octanoyltransferase [Pseudomonadota bacterium]